MQPVQRKGIILFVVGLSLALWLVGRVSADEWRTGRTPVADRQRAHIRAAEPASRTGATVQVGSNFFAPASVTIQVGDAVTWTRTGGFHNVHANDNSFRLGEPNGDPSSNWTSVSHAFLQAGTFAYICDVHGNSMKGEVIVQGAADPITGLAATSSSPTLVGSATAFTATVTGGTNISYTWAFGDGSSGNGEKSSHTYAVGGVYTATVTATNSQGSQTAATVVHVANAIVNVGNNFFAPASVTIKPGERVAWVRSAGFHNVRADDNSFRLGDANGNPTATWKVVSRVFLAVGTVPYYCEEHSSPGGSSMNGVVMVQAESSVEKKVYLPVVVR